MMRALIYLALLAQAPILKLPSETNEPVYGSPANLDFEKGVAGQLPDSWSLEPDARFRGYSAEWLREGCRTGSGCAAIRSGPETRKGSVGAIMQEFSAEPYQGKKMRLRAWVKLQTGRNSDVVKLIFATDGEKAEETYVQKGRGVNAAEWTLAEVEGKVPFRAEVIHIVVTVTGGTALVDDVTFEEVK